MFISKGIRRWYSEKIKADAVNLAEEQGYEVEAAWLLGIDRRMLDRWRRERRGQVDDAPRHAREDECDAELHWLREENRWLRTEREILKKPFGLVPSCCAKNLGLPILH